MGRWDTPFFGRVGHYFESDEYSDTPICGRTFKSVFTGGDMHPRNKCKKCVSIVKQNDEEVVS